MGRNTIFYSILIVLGIVFVFCEETKPKSQAYAPARHSTRIITTPIQKEEKEELSPKNTNEQIDDNYTENNNCTNNKCQRCRRGWRR